MKKSKKYLILFNSKVFILHNMRLMDSAYTLHAKKYILIYSVPVILIIPLFLNVNRLNLI